MPANNNTGAKPGTDSHTYHIGRIFAFAKIMLAQSETVSVVINKNGNMIPVFEQLFQVYFFP